MQIYEGHFLAPPLSDCEHFFHVSGEIDNWWDPDTEESYKKKAQCMIDQYSGFTDKQVNMKIDGVNNIGENIADNGGIKEAYNAYRKFYLNKSLGTFLKAGG